MIWATLKTENRKLSLQVKDPSDFHQTSVNQEQAHSQKTLDFFDHSSKLLEQCFDQCEEREASLLLKFNSKLMKHRKSAAGGNKYLPDECNFFKTLNDLRSRNASLPSQPERNSLSLNNEERYIELHDCLFGQR